MGLSGPRNRRKLDHDPNNTRWTRDETTFGQKILRAQGWAPGTFLGAQDASHAQLHSAASLAPIKINLKDDTLGLGAKIIQKQSDECTGLDVFKDLLGRLNGKSEETINKERQVRSEIKTHLFVERKYGPMRFVSGGLLVGEQVKMADAVENKPTLMPIKDEPMSDASDVKSVKKEKKEKKAKKGTKDKKSKKRKAGETEEADNSDSKREKKRKRAEKRALEPEASDVEVEKTTKKKKDKKGKKSKRPEKASEVEGDAEPAEPEAKLKKSKKSKDILQREFTTGDSTETPDEAAPENSKKTDKKKKKRKQTDSIDANITTTATTSSITTSAATPQDSGTSTPISAGTSTPPALSARHRVRSRYIASKKMALGDMQALNQIFMIKPV
ncbi:hypothetical protein F4777DRAFT_235364 [Nemania sp. FL0916]|nr:hypothetical protein F4777DRAFT_235364 [Nemania sp. FL0916]